MDVVLPVLLKLSIPARLQMARKAFVLLYVETDFESTAKFVTTEINWMGTDAYQIALGVYQVGRAQADHTIKQTFVKKRAETLSLLSMKIVKMVTLIL